MTNADRGFAHGGLSIQASFSGYYYISLADVLLQTCFFYYYLIT